MPEFVLALFVSLVIGVLLVLLTSWAWWACALLGLLFGFVITYAGIVIITIEDDGRRL